MIDDHPDIALRDLAVLLEAVPLPLLVVADGTRVAWANEPLAGLLGCARDDVIGSPLSALPFDRPPLAEGERYRIAGGAGRPVVVRATVRTLGRGPGLALVCFERLPGVSKLVPISPASPLGPGRRRNPGIDPGTGLLDRASIAQVLEGEVTRSRRYENPLSIVVVRLDPKRAVSAAARWLRQEIRWADNLGRLDVAELLLVLPETGAQAASALVRKLELGAARELGPGRVSFTVSQWQRGDDSSFLLRRARAAVSRAGGQSGERGEDWDSSTEGRDIQ
jgi:GGDEF domain-containing protein